MERNTNAKFCHLCRNHHTSKVGARERSCVNVDHEPPRRACSLRIRSSSCARSFSPIMAFRPEAFFFAWASMVKRGGGRGDRNSAWISNATLPAERHRALTFMYGVKDQHGCRNANEQGIPLELLSCHEFALQSFQPSSVPHGLLEKSWHERLRPQLLSLQLPLPPQQVANFSRQGWVGTQWTCNSNDWGTK